MKARKWVVRLLLATVALMAAAYALFAAAVSTVFDDHPEWD